MMSPDIIGLDNQVGRDDQIGPAKAFVKDPVRRSKRATKPTQKLSDYSWKPG